MKLETGNVDIRINEQMQKEVIPSYNRFCEIYSNFYVSTFAVAYAAQYLCKDTYPDKSRGKASTINEERITYANKNGKQNLPPPKRPNRKEASIDKNKGKDTSSFFDSLSDIIEFLWYFPELIKKLIIGVVQCIIEAICVVFRKLIELLFSSCFEL